MMMGEKYDVGEVGYDVMNEEEQVVGVGVLEKASAVVVRDGVRMMCTLWKEKPVDGASFYIVKIESENGESADVVVNTEHAKEAFEDFYESLLLG